MQRKVFVWRLICPVMILGKEENEMIFSSGNTAWLDISACWEKDTSPSMPGTYPSSVNRASSAPAEMEQDLPQKWQHTAECKTLNSAFSSYTFVKSSTFVWFLNLDQR